MVHAPDTWLDGERLTVVVGHMGSGKTEFSVNLALAMAGEGRSVTLADLDVVTPLETYYFVLPCMMSSYIF